MTTVPSLPLTSVTVESIKQEMISRLSVFFPDWTDKSESNSMVALLETISGLAELMYGYINRQAREAYIQHALDPRNVTSHAKGFGYVPKTASASIVDAVLSVPVAVSGDTPILAGSTIDSLLPGITYELMAEATILAGQTSVGPVQLKQHQSWTQVFTGTGNPNLRVTLDHANVMSDSIKVIVNGVEWTYVQDFVDADPTSQVYTIQVSTLDYSATICFGDGFRGKIPVDTAAGSVAYKTTSGAAGAIPSHYLRQVTTEVRDGGTNQVLTISADNEFPAVPGGNPETAEQIKKHAAAYLRASQVLFDLEDVENAVEALPGVLACKAVNWETLPELPHYLVEVFVLPTTAMQGDTEVSPTLSEDITTLLTTTRPLVMGHKPLVASASFRELDFTLQLFVKDGYSSTLVKQTISTLISNLFDPTLTNIWGFAPTFGMSIYSSQLIAILQSIPGVRNLVMLSPLDTQLLSNEYPKVHSVTFV